MNERELFSLAQLLLKGCGRAGLHIYELIDHEYGFRLKVEPGVRIEPAPRPSDGPAWTFPREWHVELDRNGASD